MTTSSPYTPYPRQDNVFLALRIAVQYQVHETHLTYPYPDT